jgi:hypothetical protein
MNLSWSSKFSRVKMKLLRLVPAQPFDEIEVVPEEEAFFQMGGGGGGGKIRN